MQSHDAITCPQCLVGLLKADKAAFTGVLDGMFLSVPEMDAYVCDVCGYREFSDAAVTRLEALLGELPMPGEAARPASKRASSEQDLIDRLRGPRLKP